MYAISYLGLVVNTDGSISRGGEEKGVLLDEDEGPDVALVRFSGALRVHVVLQLDVIEVVQHLDENGRGGGGGREGGHSLAIVLNGRQYVDNDDVGKTPYAM